MKMQEKKVVTQKGLLDSAGSPGTATWAVK
jgi:hypothetical protein